MKQQLYLLSLLFLITISPFSYAVPPYFGVSVEDNLSFNNEACFSVAEMVLQNDGFKKIVSSQAGLTLFAAYQNREPYRYKALVKCLSEKKTIVVVVVAEVPKEAKKKAVSLQKAIKTALSVVTVHESVDISILHTDTVFGKMGECVASFAIDGGQSSPEINHLEMDVVGLDTSGNQVYSGTLEVESIGGSFANRWQTAHLLGETLCESMCIEDKCDTPHLTLVINKATGKIGGKSTDLLNAIHIRDFEPIPMKINSLSKVKTRCDAVAYVIDDDPKGLNVRDATHKKVITRIPYYSLNEGFVLVHIIDAKKGWLKINDWKEMLSGKTFNISQTGWVYGKLVETSTRSQTGKGWSYAYATPSEIAPKTGKFAGDQSVKILDCQENWLFVEGQSVEDSLIKGWLSPDGQCPNALTTCP